MQQTTAAMIGSLMSGEAGLDFEIVAPQWQTLCFLGRMQLRRTKPWGSLAPHFDLLLLLLLLKSGSFTVDLPDFSRDCFHQVEEITARAEEAEKAQNTLASVFKISEGKAWQRGNVPPELEVDSKRTRSVQPLGLPWEDSFFSCKTARQLVSVDIIVSQCWVSWDGKFIWFESTRPRSFWKRRWRQLKIKRRRTLSRFGWNQRWGVRKCSVQLRLQNIHAQISDLIFYIAVPVYTIWIYLISYIILHTPVVDDLFNAIV